MPATIRPAAGPPPADRGRSAIAEVTAEAVWNSPSLPSLPAVAVQLLEESRRPDVDLARITELISADPALSARLLKAANSSFFGFRGEIASVGRAVNLLGASGVVSLALSFSLSDDALKRGETADAYRAYWRRCVVQAAAAELAGALSPGDGPAGGAPDAAGDWFLAGLLCDLGRLAMLKTIPAAAIAVWDAADADRTAPVARERTELGFDHAGIGGKLAEHWGLPPALAEAVRRHHAAPAGLAAAHADGRLGPAAYPLARVAVLASAAGDHFCGNAPGPSLERLRAAAGTLFGLSGEALTKFLGRVRDRADEAAGLLDVDLSDVGTPASLIAAANEHLAEIAARQSAETAALARRHEELARQHRELQERSLRDPLTGLYNRPYLVNALRREVETCARTAAAVGVIFADVDRFKAVNDTHGHAVGDRVLRAVAGAFAQVLRRSDVPARFGGEEFVVMLPRPTEAGARAVAERLRQAVAQTCRSVGGVGVNVTASFGVSLLVPDGADAADRLLAEADAAMYDAKKGGRDRVVVRSLLSPEQRELQAAVSARRFSRWLSATGALPVRDVGEALADLTPPDEPLGFLARSVGLLDDVKAEMIADSQRPGERFGEAARRLDLLTDAQLADLLARQQETPPIPGRRLGEAGPPGERRGGRPAHRPRRRRPRPHPPRTEPTERPPTRTLRRPDAIPPLPRGTRGTGRTGGIGPVSEVPAAGRAGPVFLCEPGARAPAVRSVPGSRPPPRRPAATMTGARASGSGGAPAPHPAGNANAGSPPGKPADERKTGNETATTAAFRTGADDDAPIVSSERTDTRGAPPRGAGSGELFGKSIFRRPAGFCRVHESRVKLGGAVSPRRASEGGIASDRGAAPIRPGGSLDASLARRTYGFLLAVMRPRVHNSRTPHGGPTPPARQPRVRHSRRPAPHFALPPVGVPAVSAGRVPVPAGVFGEALSRGPAARTGPGPFRRRGAAREAGLLPESPRLVGPAGGGGVGAASGPGPRPVRPDRRGRHEEIPDRGPARAVRGRAGHPRRGAGLSDRRERDPGRPRGRPLAHPAGDVRGAGRPADPVRPRAGAPVAPESRPARRAGRGAVRVLDRTPAGVAAGRRRTGDAGRRAGLRKPGGTRCEGTRCGGAPRGGNARGRRGNVPASSPAGWGRRWTP